MLLLYFLQQEDIKKLRRYQYPDMKKRLGTFEMEIQTGGFTDSEIIVMLGENGTGKTTFIRLLAGLLKPDTGGRIVLPTCTCVFCEGVLSGHVMFVN